MMSLRKVGIIGVGLAPFDNYPDSVAAEIAFPAIISALKDAGVDRDQVQAAFVAHLYQGEVFGQKLLKGLGFPRLPILNVENACAGGSGAVHEAWLSVAAGLSDVVLVVGVEKMAPGLIKFTKFDAEVAMGNVAPAQYAMAAKRHMHDFGTPPESFGNIVVKSRRHASLNPNARFRDPVTLDEVLNSRAISDPITLLQCCRNASGAAAVVLASEAWCRRNGKASVWIRGIGLSSFFKGDPGRDLTEFGGTRDAAHAAYEMAGIGAEEVNVVELHDAFAPGELLHYEGLGLCAKGEGARLVADGDTCLGGRVPVNVSGGLLSKSHPVGATGVAQFAELTWQLRGSAESRQVEGARVALAHSQGGTALDVGATAVTLISRD